MPLSTTSDLLVSIIIPVYNEAGSISAVVERIGQSLTDQYDFEIVLVDDGSRDDTLQRIKDFCQHNKRIEYLSLSRNFGHQSALKAGLDHCKGDIVISMDGDLQHPPELIPTMIELWYEGYEVVVTVREDLNDTSVLKKLSSQWFYRLLNRISSIDIDSGAADFRLLDRKVVDSLKLFNEKDLFYRGFVSWVGFRQITIPYNPGQRLAGTSKYTLKKMLQLAGSGIMGFSILPLRVVSILGFAISLLAFCYGSYAILIKLFSNQAVSGWASVMTGIYFLGGIQLFCIGLCGEYIGRIFLQVKNRPNYIVKESSFEKK